MTSTPVGNEYPVEIDEMTMADYDEVLSLLRASPGAAIRGADSREGTERYQVQTRLSTATEAITTLLSLGMHTACGL